MSVNDEKMPDGTEGFAKDYSDQTFGEKVLASAKAAGKEVIEKGLLLYYTLQFRETPPWAKAVIIAALGHFIAPIDAIPDLTPIIGFADELGVLTMVIAAAAIHITDEIKAKAATKIADLFSRVI